MSLGNEEKNKFVFAYMLLLFPILFIIPYIAVVLFSFNFLLEFCIIIFSIPKFLLGMQGEYILSMTVICLFTLLIELFWKILNSNIATFNQTLYMGWLLNLLRNSLFCRLTMASIRMTHKELTKKSLFVLVNSPYYI